VSPRRVKLEGQTLWVALSISSWKRSSVKLLFVGKIYLLRITTTKCEKIVCAYWLWNSMCLCCTHDHMHWDWIHGLGASPDRCFHAGVICHPRRRAAAAAATVPRVKTFRGRDPPRVERGVYSCHVSFEDRGEAMGCIYGGGRVSASSNNALPYGKLSTDDKLRRMGILVRMIPVARAHGSPSTG